jgi:hypothetical protein
VILRLACAYRLAKLYLPSSPKASLSFLE